MITVLGGSGFVGSHVVAEAIARGIECHAPVRDDQLEGKELGHVIYCVGLTADFRQKPFETVEAHVSHLAHVLKNTNYDSLLYLSSTRIYGRKTGAAMEEDEIVVEPRNGDHLYNISKVMGESLALNASGKTKVARLSNVYGRDFKSRNFLVEVIRAALAGGKVTLRTTLESAKDYINVNDVAKALLDVVDKGKSRVYNVATGVNVTNREIMEKLSAITGCACEVAEGSDTFIAPLINVDKIKAETGFAPARLMDEMEWLVDMYSRKMGPKHG
ncbi:MAG: NAD-dependent epimerase/dehydratase family protein [Nitrospinae bacterium]|nr:NAD-dependent epimerase/dehydratase family protein [Nitrospinota bacterium]